MRRFAEAMVALFQFLIGKVQHMARKLTKAEKDLFQFLIGKVQLKETRKKAVKRLVISFNSS